MLALALLVAHQPIIDPNPKVLEENRDVRTSAWLHMSTNVHPSFKCAPTFESSAVWQRRIPGHFLQC